MAESVGEIYYSVDARTEGLIAAEREVRNSTERTGRAVEKTSGEMDKLAASVKRAAIAYVSFEAGRAAISRIIRDTAGFEKSMLGLQAKTRASAAEMANLEAQARQLGATTQYSAKQTADAQNFLAQAGFNVNEVLSATPGILSLATAGNLDLARAADIASNVLGGMGLDVAELSRVNDVLAATSASANTNVEQLGQALSFAAPFASSAGISIEQASAAIGVMSDSGIQASRAGTGLVGVIRQLSKVTPDAEKALAKYGLSAEDVNIETHGLETVMRRLGDANLSTADALAIFGTEAGTAGQTLAKSSERLGEFTTELENAEGEAGRMAKILGGGLAGSINTFNSALGETILQLGEGGVGGAFGTLLDTLSGVLSSYNGMLDVFAEANDIGETHKMVIQGIADGVRLLATLMAGRLLAAAVTSKAAMAAYAGATTLATGATNLLTGAMGRQAAAAGVAAAATRGASAAFGLIGGPAGAAILAGMAIYHFREELELVKPTIRTVDELTREYSRGINTMSESAANNRLHELQADLRQTGIDAVNAARALAVLERVQGESSSFGQGQQADLRAGRAKREAELQGYLNKLEALELSINAVYARMNPREEYKAPDVPDSPGVTGSVSPAVAAGSSRPASSSQPSAPDTSARDLARLRQSLETEQEAIERSYRERNEAILRLTEEGSAERRMLTERNAADYLQSQQELKERERENERQHLEEMARLQDEARIAELEKISIFNEAAARKAAEIQDRMQDPLKAMSEELGTMFVNLDNSLSSAFANAIMEGDSLKDSFYAIGRSITSQLLAALIKVGLQYAINAAIGQSAQAAVAASAAASGSAVAASWAPAAAMASLASFGANAAPANMALAGTVATAKGLAAVSGRQYGGNTNAGQMYRVNEGGAPELFTQGTQQYLLSSKRGEVTSGRDMKGGAMQAPPVTVNLIGEGAKNARVEEEQGPEGERVISLFLEDLGSDGPMTQSMRRKFSLFPQGR